MREILSRQPHDYAEATRRFGDRVARQRSEGRKEVKRLALTATAQPLPSGSCGYVVPVFSGQQRLGTLVDAGIALSSELSLDALLQGLAEPAAELTGARYAALGVIGPGGRDE